MRIQALITKVQPTNEYDLLVTCYTPEMGKLTAVAKSALKHGSIQGMHLASLSLVDFELIEGRAMPIVAAAQSTRVYSGIKQSLSRLAMAQFFTEVVERMVFDRQRDTQLWEFLTQTLDGLEHTSDERALSWFRGRQIALLQILGYEPQLDRCIQCGSSKSIAGWGLSVEAGGTVCSACFITGTKAVLISNRELALLQGETTNVSSVGMKSAVDALYEYHAGASFISLQVLYGLSGLT